MYAPRITKTRILFAVMIWTGPSLILHYFVTSLEKRNAEKNGKLKQQFEKWNSV